jgi:hypothetical protein
MARTLSRDDDLMISCPQLPALSLWASMPRAKARAGAKAHGTTGYLPWRHRHREAVAAGGGGRGGGKERREEEEVEAERGSGTVGADVAGCTLHFISVALTCRQGSEQSGQPVIYNRQHRQHISKQYMLIVN